MTLAAKQQLVKNLVRDDNAVVSVVQLDEAIALAVRRYSADRPKTKVEDVLCAAGGNALANPVSWLADFSRATSLEYPIGDIPPTLIANDRWRRYATPSGEQFQLDDALPANATVRVTYGIKHTLDGTTDTIPDVDEEAFALLAASMLCNQLAAYYSNRSESTIQADTVNNESQAREYRAQGASYLKQYLNRIGVDEKRTVAAGVVVPLRRTNSVGGTRLIQRGKPL
jgi:hypothetical protein